MNFERQDVRSQFYPLACTSGDHRVLHASGAPKGESESAIISKVPRHFMPDAGIHFSTADSDPICLSLSTKVSNAAHSKIVSAHLLKEREAKFGVQDSVPGEERSVALALFQVAQHSLYANFLSRKVYEDLIKEWADSEESLHQVYSTCHANVDFFNQVIFLKKE